MKNDPDQLVTITTATSEFTAHILISILEDAGVQAFTFGSTGTTLGVAGQSTNPRWGAPVQVRRADLDTAREILLANRRDSIDIDWNQVDVGTESRIDDGSTPGRNATPREDWMARRRNACCSWLASCHHLDDHLTATARLNNVIPVLIYPMKSCNNPRHHHVRRHRTKPAFTPQSDCALNSHRLES